MSSDQDWFPTQTLESAISVDKEYQNVSRIHYSVIDTQQITLSLQRCLQSLQYRRGGLQSSLRECPYSEMQNKGQIS